MLIESREVCRCGAPVSLSRSLCLSLNSSCISERVDWDGFPAAVANDIVYAKHDRLESARVPWCRIYAVKGFHRWPWEQWLVITVGALNDNEQYHRPAEPENQKNRRKSKPTNNPSENLGLNWFQVRTVKSAVQRATTLEWILIRYWLAVSSSSSSSSSSS